MYKVRAEAIYYFWMKDCDEVGELSNDCAHETLKTK
jgi:hypothetical protein